MMVQQPQEINSSLVKCPVRHVLLITSISGGGRSDALGKWVRTLKKKKRRIRGLFITEMEFRTRANVEEGFVWVWSRGAAHHVQEGWVAGCSQVVVADMQGWSFSNLY